MALTTAAVAGAVVVLGRRRSSHASVGKARTCLAADGEGSWRKRWFSNRRNTLAKELRTEIKEERQIGKDLQEQLKAENEAAEATLTTLTSQLQQLRIQEASLREELRDAEEQERASEQRLEDVKEQVRGRTSWRAVIEQQTQMLEKILEVAERLERREQQLRADLAKRRENNEELQMDLQMAADLANGATLPVDEQGGA